MVMLVFAKDEASSLARCVEEFEGDFEVRDKDRSKKKLIINFSTVKEVDRIK
jgi:hypothetical protein